MTQKPKYITWPALNPIPHDASMFRRLWVKVRNHPTRHAYSLRRALAHDYAVAKCSGALPVGDCEECGERWPLRKAGRRWLCEVCWSEAG